jgi:hypothetical protein
MYERYTEKARHAIFLAREEAARVGSSYIEPEHLLLGVMRFCEAELDEALNLKGLEDSVRTEVARTAPRNVTSKNAFLPISNQSKRILEYAVEEADQLKSTGIGSGHLLLGILRESENIASRLLMGHAIDLPRARQVVATLPPPQGGATSESIRSHIEWVTQARRHYGIAAATQVALMILVGVVVAKSTVSGRALLVIGVIWLLLVCAWLSLRPSSMWGVKFSGRTRALAMLILYAFLWLYQLLLYGWLIPLAIGIYRVAQR